MTAAFRWPRANCKLCGESNLIAHVLDYEGYCPTCAATLSGDEPVTKTWLCEKCGARMFSGGYSGAGGGRKECCWRFPTPVRETVAMRTVPMNEDPT